MATALQAQLAQISASSSDPLNLKAHRKAHAQSLLFEEAVAAQQSKDDLFEICYEGFEELCTLEPRFRPFGKTIFSEESKRQDRSQLTASQNQELDRVLESFLSLVGSRILLKPALKALEGLIRQFRVHEMNTAYVLYTFLPYHTLPHFGTLVSILPKKIPSNFQFLVPYQSKPAPLPRQELVYAATRNASFWREWSYHVLGVCRQGNQYHNMVAHWAGIVTEALIGQIEKASRGNRASEQQKIQDIVLNVLPFINEVLSSTLVDDVRIAALMLLTVLASKTELADRTLEKAMEAVVEHSTLETRDGELICLSILAQKRTSVKLPRRVLRVLSSIDSLGDDLSTLSEQYHVGNLILGVIEGAAKNRVKKLSTISPALVETVLGRKILTEEQSQLAVLSILQAAKGISEETPEATRKWILETVQRISEADHCRSAIQNSLRLMDGDVSELEATLQLSLQIEFPNQGSIEMELDLPEPQRKSSSQEQLFDQIPTRKVDGSSFFVPAEHRELPMLIEAFKTVTSSESLRAAFTSLPIFQTASGSDNRMLLSFLLRVLCSRQTAHVRSSALHMTADCMKEENRGHDEDIQMLMPYMVYALSDESESVRGAAVSLVTTLRRRVVGEQRDDKNDKTMPSHPNQSWYGDSEDQSIGYLSRSSMRALFSEIFLPNLEEYRSDPSFISQVLFRCLRHGHSKSQSANESPSIKKNQKESIFTMLLDHIAQSPLLSFQMQLLSVLRDIPAVGHTVKSTHLNGLMKGVRALSESALVDQCLKESISHLEYLATLFTLIDPRKKPSLDILEEVFRGRGLNGSAPFQAAALQRLQEIWESIKPDIATKLVQAIFDRAAGPFESETTNEKNIYLETLRQLSLSQEVITGLLDVLPKMSSSGEAVKPLSKRRKINSGPEKQTGNELMVAFRRITLALELIEASQGATPAIVPLLFDLLADLHNFKDIDSSVTYTQTLLMDVLNTCIHKAASSTTLIDRHSLRVDLVVDSFRNSSNTQLQQASLLLMSGLAIVAPDETIHSIMPVFTFMGSALLRQVDDFSMHVIDKTIESVIPPLVVSLQKDKRGALAGVSELMLSFVAAFEHIAPHRRQDLFALLVDKIDPESFLFVFVTMLIDKHGDEKDIIDFAINLAARYPPHIQMSAIRGCLDAILDSHQRRPSMAKHLFSLERYPDYVAAALAVAHVANRWMRSNELIVSISKLLRRDDASSIELRNNFAKLLELALRLINQTKNSKALASASHDLLQSLLAMFPLEHSIQTLHELLQTGSDSLRCQVLDSLDVQISGQKSGSQAVRIACLEFLPRLQSLLSESSSLQLKKRSISCIDHIVEKYGKVDHHATLEAARDIIGPSGLANQDPQLKSAALLCLTTMVEVLEDEFIPNVPRTLPACLTILESDLKEPDINDGPVSSAWTFISAVILYLPYILTGQYLDGVLRMAFEGVVHVNKIKFNNGSKNATTLVPGQIPAQECFSALSRTWGVAESKGLLAVNLHLSILDSAVEKVSKVVAIRQSSSIASLVLSVMDLRRLKISDPSFSEADLVDIEASLNATMMKMIYKLNDKHFRPIFARMVEWSNDDAAAGTSTEKAARRTSLYGFAAHFFQTLKSIVTGYSSFITEGATEILRDVQPHASDASMILWSRVVSTLTASFEHDQDEFWQSPARFESVASTVVAQLDHGADGQAADRAIACISSLAMAADSPDNMKVVNSAILERFRHQDQAMRLAAVKCQQALTDGLGEEWLGLLPEMLPFISEAMEDDDEQVEMETRRWVERIEEILGESLDPMLQ